MRRIVFALVFASVLLLVGSVAGATYTLNVSTDSQTYVAAATIHLGGQVSPAPGPNTAVLIRIFNSNKIIVTADEAPVNGTTGLYTDSIVAAGSTYWIDGLFTVNASWGAYSGQTVFAITTFSWFSSVSTTTSSTSSPTTSTSSSSTSSSTSSTTHTTTSVPTSSSTTTKSTPLTTSTTSSSGGGGGGIPEFPFEYLTVAVLTALVVVSYLYISRGRKAPLSLSWVYKEPLTET